MYSPDSFLVRLYQRAPVPVQNLFFSLAGLKNYRTRYNAHFFNHLNFLKESEWWSETKIEEYQSRQLQWVAKHAYQHVPLVKSVFDRAGVTPEQVRSATDLKALPLMNKNILRDATVPFHDTSLRNSEKIKVLTSGTSGRALEVIQTKNTLAFQWAVWARHKERFGIRLGDKHLTFGARVPIDARQEKPPFWRWNYFGKQMYLSTFHLSPKHLPAIVDFLQTTPFDYYTGYPSSMYVVAKYMQEKGIHLKMRPKYIITGSDALTPHFESVIRQQFGVPVTEQYGMAEACGNLAKCEFGRFHVDFEFGILELLDQEHDPNSCYKRMVFTSLANSAMPLFRYDIGDLAEVDHMKCRCGRKSYSVKSIVGRLEDYILTPDGRKVTGMNQVFEWANGIREIQVVQHHTRSILVNYIPDHSFSSTDLKKLEIEFRKRIGDDIIINFQKVDIIPRTANGKFKAVVSYLKEGGIQ